MELAAIIAGHLAAIALVANAGFRYGRASGLSAAWRHGYELGRRDQLAIDNDAAKKPRLRVVRDGEAE